MNKTIFISYRRDDSAPIARALAENLRYRFGADRVFLDEDSLRHGEVWTDRLQQEVGRAGVILALIGPAWLTASDRYGRRRLDIDNDWVRRELVFAKTHDVAVIPLLVGDNHELPEEGLPEALAWLHEIQMEPLQKWHEDVSSLVRLLIERHGFLDIQRDAGVKPEPGVKKRFEPPLSEDELERQLKSLEGWEPVESAYPPRRELRKVFHFPSFQRAIEFMVRAVPRIEEKPVHHPRWENQYKAVSVYFSTWDAGSKITKFDVDAARMMDEIYGSFGDERE